MSIKFSVKMTEQYMYDFLMHHTYTHMSGILGVIVGVLGLGMGIDGLIKGDTAATAIGFVIAIAFLFSTPGTTKSKARMQVKQTGMFQKPLDYELNDTGIIVRQGDQEAVNEWGEFTKVVSTRKSIVLYTSRVRAIIFPKECMGDQYEEILQMIRTHIAPSKVKIRHIH